MKVVINVQHGGFSLSAEGEAAYLSRQGKQAFFYTEVRDDGVPYGERDYVRVTLEEANRSFMSTTLTADVGERVSHDVIWPKGQYHRSYWNDR